MIGKISLAIVILAFSYKYLIWRFLPIASGGESQLDTAVIAISAIIILLPFLSEIELFGVKFKKEMEKIEKETSEKIRLLEQKITSIQTQNNSQNIYFSKNDEELKRLTNVVQETVVEPSSAEKTKAFQMPSQIYEMLATSYNLNRRLSSIYEKSTNSPRYFHTNGGMLQIISYLDENKIIDLEMAQVIKEIIAICNSARHGEEIATIQYDFVKDTAPSIIAYLDDKLNELK